jgi:hypothetical protein
LACDCDIDEMFQPSLFPNLRVQIKTSDDGMEDCDITIYKSVGTGCLFNCVLKTPMRQSMTTRVFLPFPRCVYSVRLEGEGYLYDDGQLDFEEEYRSTPLVGRRPSGYSNTIFVKHEALQQSTTPSAIARDPVSAKEVVGSLLDLLKIVGWSDRNLEAAPDDHDAGGYRSPCIVVNLLTQHLPHLIERVSRKDVTHSRSLLIHHATGTRLR